MERTPAPTPTSSGLHSVDQSVDPTTRFRFLGAEGAKPAMMHAKQRSFDLLEVKPGGHYLDVGCGTGDDVCTLAGMVGEGGRVTGVDIDSAMVAEAEKRAAPRKLPVDFRQADVYNLPFPDATFDGIRADRTFLHIADPERAIAQIARVLKRDGRFVVQDRDIGTRTIDSPDRALTRRILDFWCDSFLGGWIGRKLPRLYEEAGLVDTTIESVTVIDRDYEAFNQQYNLKRIVERGVDAGVINHEEGYAWLNQLEKQAAAGQFFTSVTSFIVCGRKP